jgi:hypothetical protein
MKQDSFLRCERGALSASVKVINVRMGSILFVGV